MAKATVRWDGKMAFRGETESGHFLTMDARESVGGENRGPRPGEVVLLALGGCTGMDVVSILGKMRIDFDEFWIELEGRQASDHPKIYTGIRLVYKITGQNIPPDKFKRAVELSQEKYCVVSNMLNKASAVTYELEINGERVRVG